jgi:type I restriction enzyme S subunit
MKGAAGQKRVPDQFFQNFPQFLPPEDEQKTIVQFLNRETGKIRGLIEKKEKLIDLLEEKRASVINKLVTSGVDDSEQRSVNIDWFDSIPEDWETTSLRNSVDKFVDYRGATPEKSDTGITLITAKNIDNGKLDFSEDHEYVSEEVYEEWMTRGKPEEGDVLITTEAPMGEVAQIHETPVALAQRIILLKVNTELLKKEFLKYYLESEFNQTQLIKSQTGSTAKGIRASKLKDISIFIPPISEQIEIIETIEQETQKIDELTSDIEEGIERLKEYRTALITEAVTGQIDVRGEV